MLYMDLKVNGTQIYQCQPCFGQMLIRSDSYLGVDGGLMFADTQGWDDPTWDGLGGRYQLLYLSDQPIQVIPLKASPVQNLACILNGQNCVIGVYDQALATSAPPGAIVPVGSDLAYTNQALLAPTSSYVESGYWVDYAV